MLISYLGDTLVDESNIAPVVLNTVHKGLICLKRTFKDKNITLSHFHNPSYALTRKQQKSHHATCLKACEEQLSKGW